MVFAPCGLLGIPDQIRPGDVVIVADGATTKASIANKLSRGTVAATFLLATLAAFGMEALRLEDL